MSNLMSIKLDYTNYIPWKHQLITILEAYSFIEHIEGTLITFLLAVWFKKIKVQTIVWSANGNKPAPEGSKLKLNSYNEFSQ